MTADTCSIDKEFIVMSPEKNAFVETNDASLYERLGKVYGGFAGHDLVSCHEFDGSWSSWEIHPNGDEIVILLSGKVEFILEVGDENQSIILETLGEYAIVPKNTWHTAKTDTHAKVLFITPGEGTQNRDL